MIPSSADATAAARRIQANYPGGASVEEALADARLLAGFVLAGDTERLREQADELARSLRYLRGILRAILDVDGWNVPVAARDELIALAADADAALAGYDALAEGGV